MMQFSSGAFFVQIWRQRYVVSLIFFAFVVIGILILALASPLYTATMLIAPKPDSVSLDSGQFDPRSLLGEIPTRAARLGAGAPSLIKSAEVVENEWIGGFVDVPRDDCLLSYARASSSIRRMRKSASPKSNSPSA